MPEVDDYPPLTSIHPPFKRGERRMVAGIKSTGHLFVVLQTPFLPVK